MAPGAGDVDALMMKQCSFSLSDSMPCVCVCVCVCVGGGGMDGGGVKGGGGFVCVHCVCKCMPLLTCFHHLSTSIRHLI